eukprot:3433749-Amphidinium_carterae.1
MMLALCASRFPCTKLAVAAREIIILECSQQIGEATLGDQTRGGRARPLSAMTTNWETHTNTMLARLRELNPEPKPLAKRTIQFNNH